MDSNSSKHGGTRDLDDVIEHDPQSKHGSEGEAAHGGRVVGPNSDQAGKPQAPQTGDPHGDDRHG